jgi:putative ABC transport system permease protein
MISRVRRKYLGGVMRIALASLLQHRLRSLLSVVGIICGVSAVFAILSIGEGAKREVLAGIRQLGLDNIILRRIDLPEPQLLSLHNRSEGLQAADVQILQAASPAVLEVAYLKELQVRVSGLSRQITPQVVACSSSYLSVQGLTLRSGRFILRQDQQRKSLVCVLGETLAGRLGPQGRVGARLRIENQLFLIVGIVRGAAPVHPKRTGMVLGREVNEMLFLPFGSHLYLSRGEANDRGEALDEITLKLTGQSAVEAILPLIHRTMELSHHGIRDYQLIVPRQLMLQARRTQRIFNLVLGSIGGISLVVGGIGIMNVLLATISERTREIGIRRAVGATREDIIAQFLAEAILLTTAGGILGILAGLVCAWSIARFADWSVAITLYGLIVPLLTSAAVGLCAGIYPALKAAKMDPVRALRSA